MENDFKIRKQIRYDEIKYGITKNEKNGSFITVLPFEYENIIEKKGCFNDKKEGKKDYYYYVFYDANGKEGIFLDGNIILPSDEYENIELLPCSDEQNLYCKARKTIDEEQLMGILHIDPKNKKIAEAYAFGKADEIEVIDNRANLYKNIGERKLIGVFQDQDLGTLDPDYTFLDYQSIDVPKRTIKNVSYSKSSRINPHSLQLVRGKKDKIGILYYGKIENNQELQGLLSRGQSQEVELLSKDIKETERFLSHAEFYDSTLTSKNYYAYKETETEWQDFIPCEYNKILFKDAYNNEKSFQQFSFHHKNFLNLVKEKDGKKYYGAQVFAFAPTNEEKNQWPTWQIKPLLTIPCQYDETIKTLTADYHQSDNEYLLTKKNNKEGLIKLAFNLPKKQENSNTYPIVTLEKMLENSYDKISSQSLYSHIKAFVFEKYYEEDLIKTLNHTKKGLIYDLKNPKGEFLKTECQYNAIDNLIDYQKYALTDQFKRQSALILKKIKDGDINNEPVYGFVETPSIYKRISPLVVSGFLKSTELLVGTKDADLKDIIKEDKVIVDNIIRGINFAVDCFYFEKLTDNGNEEKWYMGRNGEVLLESIPMKQKVRYFSELESFMIEKEGVLEIIQRKDKTFNASLLEGAYSEFDIDSLSKQQMLIKYKKHSERDDEKYGLLKCWHEENEIKVAELLNNEYASLEVVSEGKKTIAGVTKDYHIAYGLEEKTENPKVWYGMIDNEAGEVCLPFEFDKLNYYSETLLEEGFFIGEKNENGEISYIVYDKDGYKSGVLKKEEWMNYQENQKKLKLRKK